jgi:hypothetical protein
MGLPTHHAHAMLRASKALSISYGGRSIEYGERGGLGEEEF